MVQGIVNDGQNVVFVANDVSENVEVVSVATVGAGEGGNPKRISKATEAALFAEAPA